MNTRESSIDCLPSEILSDVFLRLPLKTLLRIRFVCKTWNSIISGRNIAQLHLRHSRTKNDQSTEYLLSCKSGRLPYPMTINVRCSKTLDVVEDLNMDNFKVVTPHIVGYVDGVLLIHTYDPWVDYDNSAIFLLNPTIRKVVGVPLYELSLNKSTNVNFGFGFDPLSRDYKVVQVENHNMVLKTRVYNLSSNSWNLPKETNCSISGDVHLGKMLHTINFDGGIYWSGWIKTNGKKSSYFVRFDLSSEALTSLKLPDFKQGEEEQTRLRRPSVLNNSLALVDVVSGMYSHEHIRVWSRVKGGSKEVDSWMELYTMDFSQMAFACLKSNGDIYLRGVRWTTRGKIVVCNLESIEEKRHIENVKGIIFLDSYTPSLVLLGHPVVSLNGNSESKETS